MQLKLLPQFDEGSASDKEEDACIPIHIAASLHRSTHLSVLTQLEELGEPPVLGLLQNGLNRAMAWFVWPLATCLHQS